jgi:hypothetical protein
MQPKKYDYYIGIDAGVNTGFAVYNARIKKLISVQSLLIHEAMNAILCLNSNTKIFVEDARKWNGGGNANKAQGAGSVKRDCKIWEDFLNSLKIDFEMIRPNKAMTKWDAKTFKAATNYTGTTNQHGRDAAMLVYGR